MHVLQAQRPPGRWTPQADSFPPHRVWAGGDLAPRQTLANGPGWVTDCLFVDSPAWRKLVVAAQDRTVGAGCWEMWRSAGWAAWLRGWVLGRDSLHTGYARQGGVEQLQGSPLLQNSPDSCSSSVPHPHPIPRTTPLPRLSSPSTTRCAPPSSCPPALPAPAPWARPSAWRSCSGRRGRRPVWCGETQVGGQRCSGCVCCIGTAAV